jgi:hypothetical protein
MAFQAFTRCVGGSTSERAAFPLVERNPGRTRSARTAPHLDRVVPPLWTNPATARQAVASRRGWKRSHLGAALSSRAPSGFVVADRHIEASSNSISSSPSASARASRRSGMPPRSASISFGRRSSGWARFKLRDPSP